MISFDTKCGSKIAYFTETLGNPSNQSALASPLGDCLQFRELCKECEVCVWSTEKECR